MRNSPLPQVDKEGSKAENRFCKNSPATAFSPRGVNENGPWNQVEIYVGIFSHTAEISAAGFEEVQEKHKRF